ncbi:hypothetical protein DRE_04138 [Drechslerella stenobrocha 248]|uniref:F-box domain-containing protein n=1 Tax=Drechslerella stenobrocha 248 TaxID=1043628 RepID=W7HRI5_9PEZI|nr:hypothetical protein DRE_04138 [Drechslerella stenobrocha 248]
MPEPHVPSEDSASSNPPLCFVNLLPPELLSSVFAAIDDPPTLCRAERTCHLWRSIIDNQSLWRNLAIKLANPRILPERLNELGKGSLITGRYAIDRKTGSAQWIYLYRDLVRNIHSFNRIPSSDYRALCYENAPGSPRLQASLGEPKITNVTSSMPDLSELPEIYAGSSAHVARRIDFTSSAVEGMRLQNRPLQTSKTPPFTDCLCPGETAAEETAWVFFADQVPAWPRLEARAIFLQLPPISSHTTIQRGVIRAGTNGIFGDGYWRWPKHETTDIPFIDPITPLKTEEAQAHSNQTNADILSSGPERRSWKVFTTTARVAATFCSNLPPSFPESNREPANHSDTAQSLHEASEQHRSAFFERSPEPMYPILPPGPIKWAAPIDTAHTLPHARRWDVEHTVYHSFKRVFDLNQEEQELYTTSINSLEDLTNTMYGEMKNHAHSDPNLRIVYARLEGSFPEVVATKVERLALPPGQSLKRDENYPQEPVPAINQTWNLFGKAKWSLVSVPCLDEAEALEIDQFVALEENPDPWWTHETQFLVSEDQEVDEFETSNKWEFHSCGDYLIVSDDVSMSGPCTISCFKAGYHTEKSNINPRNHLRGAALRNYLAAGPTSDLVWQKSMRSAGYTLDRPSLSTVRCLQDPAYPNSRPCFFLDNDGLALNSKVVVYATRKKIFYKLDANCLMRDDAIDNLSCMEFHVISLENGQTLNILELEHEKRMLASLEPWYGWTSFVVSDTHLLATVGGNMHIDSGAEHESNTVARTWNNEHRYGREEIFVWPLDDPTGQQNLSLPLDERKILPTGRLAAGFNEHRWWRRDRYLCLSRDGRFLSASSKYDLIVWDLWDLKVAPAHYYFDKEAGGLELGADGYPISTADNVAWNGVWLQYRDIVVDPAKKNFTQSNPQPDHELRRGVIFIPNSELRMHIGGADYTFQSTVAGQVAAGNLDRVLKRRYHPGTHDDDEESDESTDWETDPEVASDYDIDMADSHFHLDEDGNYFFDPDSNYDDDDEEMYDSDDSEAVEAGFDISYVGHTQTTPATASETHGVTTTEDETNDPTDTAGEAHDATATAGAPPTTPQHLRDILTRLTPSDWTIEPSQASTQPGNATSGEAPTFEETDISAWRIDEEKDRDTNFYDQW